MLVGRSVEGNNAFYNFFEVGTKSRVKGTSLENRLYLNGRSMSGNPASNKKRTYHLSQVRPRK